jgi:class 3 adenylate cyclase
VRGPVRKTLDAIARVRELDPRRAAAERARANLSRYFSPHFAALLAERDDPLGAVRRQHVGVLFADIVGFTQMAERMTPEAVVMLLRQFHERMTAQIFACGGSVEKYVGDEIFAVFGVPEPNGNDAAAALRCAARMIAALDVWNGERKQQGEMPLAFGIGLNCGPAVIGDVGSEHSLSFTVIGDTVNYREPTAGAYAQPQHPARRCRRNHRRYQRDPTAGRGRTYRWTARAGRANPPRQKRAGSRMDLGGSGVTAGGINGECARERRRAVRAKPQRPGAGSFDAPVTCQPPPRKSPTEHRRMHRVDPLTLQGGQSCVLQSPSPPSHSRH